MVMLVIVRFMADVKKAEKLIANGDGGNGGR